MTVFFYCQHYRVVKRYDIDKLITLNDVTIWVKEMSLENYRPSKKQQEMLSEYKAPWYFKVAQKLPRPLQIPFIKVCHFYTIPYEFDNQFGTLRVEGMFLFKTDKLYPDYYNIWDIIDMDIIGDDQRYYVKQKEIMHHTPSNYLLFSLEGNNVPFANNFYNFVVTDKRSKETRSFNVSPQWETKAYTYFNRGTGKYGFSPLDTAYSFILPMRQGKNEEARKLIMEGAAAAVWPAIDHGYWKMKLNHYVFYVGNLRGYENVYSSNITFGHMPDTGGPPEDLVPVASQKIYFVIRDNYPLVIDADPVAVLPGRD